MFAEKLLVQQMCNLPCLFIHNKVSFEIWACRTWIRIDDAHWILAPLASRAFQIGLAATLGHSLYKDHSRHVRQLSHIPALALVIILEACGHVEFEFSGHSQGHSRAALIPVFWKVSKIIMVHSILLKAVLIRVHMQKNVRNGVPHP